METTLKNSLNTAVGSVKVTIKLILIFCMLLAFLVPKVFITDLISDREHRQDEITHNLAAQIGGSQKITGPILCIPYEESFEKEIILPGGNKEIEKQVVQRWAYFLPEKLDISSLPQVENKNKNIYKVPYYQAENHITGTFNFPSFEKWDIDLEDVQFENSELAVGLSSLNGLTSTPTCTVGQQRVDFEPGLGEINFLQQGMRAKVGKDWLEAGGKFDITMNLKGTNTLSFKGIARENRLAMKSNWPHPDFEGDALSEQTMSTNSLPANHDITSAGFTANWEESRFSAASKQWLNINTNVSIGGQSMGTRFINMNDHYAKTQRSIKYMALIVGLLFLAFFLIELLKESKVHPFQYIMIGAAIAVFFVLLLAVSEYVGFNVSYLIAAIATTVLIGLYSISVFRNRSLASGVSMMLVVLFTFLYVILAAAQYSLLLGAIGLFVILGAVMFFTRKVNWYGSAEELSTS